MAFCLAALMAAGITTSAFAAAKDVNPGSVTFDQDSFITVSYTHLDVYKRQDAQRLSRLRWAHSAISRTHSVFRASSESQVSEAES